VKNKITVLFIVLSLLLVFSIGVMAEQPQEGGELVFSIGSDIDDFNPFTNQTLTFIKTFGFNCYESLLHIGPDMEHVPDLATSWERVDPKTYRFNIREDVKFHNGEILTAEDVKFSIEYTQDPDLGSWLQPYFANVDEIKIIDDYSIEITLTEVSPTLLDDLSMLKIIKKGTEDELRQTPIGTGAFEFVSWSPNERIVLERFDDYWEEGKPYLEKLVLRPIPDSTIQLTNLEAGTINMLEGLPVSEIERIQSADTLKIITTDLSNETLLFEVGINNVEPFQNEKVMQALVHAFPRDIVKDSVFEGLGSIITSIYPTGAQFYKEMPAIEYNEDKAKELLAEAGYEDGFEFTIEVLSGNIEHEQTAVIYQNSLRNIGIDAKINIQEMSQWLDKYVNRSFDMIVNWYPMAGTDPSIYNNQILLPLVKEVLPDPDYLVELINKGAREEDQEARERIYHEIQEIVFAKKPIIPVLETPILYAAEDDVKGVEVNPVGHLFFKNTWLEK